MSLLTVLGLKANERVLAGVASAPEGATSGARASAPGPQPGASGLLAGNDGGTADTPTTTTSTAPDVPGPAPTGASGVQEGGSGPAAAPPVDKNLAAYATVRAAVRKQVDDLNAHPQKSHITADIASATAKFGDADTLAAAKDYAKATKALVEAKAICAKAKTLADDWANYARQLADMTALAMSFGSADFDWKAWANPKIGAANALANASPPNFAAAIKKLKDDIGKVGEPIVKKNIADAKAKLALIEKTSKAAQAFAKADVDEGKGYLAAAEKARAEREWSVSLQNSGAAMRVLGPASRMCDRRVGYDAQRATTVAAVAKVRAVPALKDRADALDKQVRDADALAAADSLKIEAGIAALKTATTQAGVWAGLAKTVATHAKDRADADAALAALDTHAAAARITTQRDAIRKILVDAKALAATADTAPDPAALWNATLTEVTRARTDLAAAKKLADSLGTASAAEAAAGKPGDTKALKAALDKLSADGKVSAKAPNADAAKAEFQTFDAQAKAATTALAASDGATAAIALSAAASALTAAKSIQASHAQYVTLLATVEAELEALKKSPRAALIQPRIAPIETGLATAKAKDQAHAGTEALVALRAANDAVAAAKKADSEREKYDKRAGEIDKLVAKVADATEKAALVTLATDAKKDADALKFDDSGKGLDQIEVRLDKAQAETLMKAANPDAKKLAALAARMVGKGGAATVDKIIHDIPDRSDPAAMNALAQGRYGVKFKTGKPLPAVAATGTTPAIPAGDPVKAMREVCDMFATIPEDVVKNPSIKGVEYSDAIGKGGGTTAGGSFSYDDAKVRMLGRPGIPQQFGANQQGQDPKTGASVPQLPAAIDPDCQAKDVNTPVEYMGFAAAHEVAHAIDDKRGFMAKHGSEPKFGGWTTYGASVQPIADAIGADPRYAAFYKTAEQKKYVLDTLLNKPTTPPAAAPLSPEDVARQAFDTWHSIATSANVYRRQGDCDTLKLGDYVYHEAYSRVWVRYLAAARNKALTGYQFRAPGEWFSELYAGYRSNKLKDTHPAMEWLKTL